MTRQSDAPVLTVFAGPNGSGKTTLKEKIFASGYNLGTYINADDIVIELRDAQSASREPGMPQREYEIAAFEEAGRRREECLNAGFDFSFETVFSHISKVEFLKEAKDRGFYVRLFFICLESPLLNVARVQKRVHDGGHDVPTDKIISRWHRALNHLALACEHVDEAIIFDNSELDMRAVVHFTRRADAPPHYQITQPIPAWVMEWLLQMAHLWKVNSRSKG